MIWNRFLEQYPDEYISVQYDLHIGEPPPFNTLYDDGTDYNQDMLYRMRIDVVGHEGSRIDIIEVKPNAGPSALGQLESYATLYERDEEPALPIRMVLITDRERPNMHFLCKEKNVILKIV
jgi:hypothetical protein